MGRSLRFYVTAAATANYADRAYLFGDDVGAVFVAPLPFIRPGSLEPVHVGGVEVDTAAVPPVYGSGSPSGGGQVAGDAAPREHENAPYTQQASPKPMWSARVIRIKNAGAGALLFSFDGDNDHGLVAANETREFRDRYEAGIAIKGVGGATPTFTIEAW